MIFQELLATCDCRRIAEIWNDHWPEYEKPLDLEAVTDSVQSFCGMLQKLLPKDTNRILLAFENYADGCKGIDAELMERSAFCEKLATVYKGNIIKNLIMDCQSYTKYRPNETTGGIFVSWRRKEELPTGA